MRGWTTARSSDNQAVVGRIMLRFRPIAPKPVGGDAASSTADQNSGVGRRVKRKYVRVRGRKSKLCGKKSATEEKTPSPPEKFVDEDESPPQKAVVTLQLLGDNRSESDERSCESSLPKSQENWKTDRYSEVVRYKMTADSGERTADLRSNGSVIETWVIVESVTDKFTGVGLGFSDKEKIYDLEKDTCPGFVSDWSNKVIWVNEAYKRMVAEDHRTAAEKGFLVWLVVKDELPYICPSFACRVRVTQQKGQGQGQGQKWNKIVPCDVWRLQFAGFAWKLDVNTALSLGF